ncbi:MMPL family transporter [Salinibacterium sp. NSLL150]|nr:MULTISPECIES: MMPL family transporter [unclassified Salinibacterium]MBH0098566.1 MMPL family transporter [Salinibacterium sp. NSLL35]MBH0101321.1 MMPL family transporter [Salinibacterium sp. NSLL150]MBH0104080.1 MMPL family transporter [Salinibacterium sp. NSLL16]MBH0106841.1 MMPL family transporter [Salinibacterium sp. NSLL17]
MATLLYRLGRFSYRHPWRVLVVWFLLVVGTLGGGIALGGQTEESFEIPGTESQVALDRLEAVFPSVAGASATAVVVAEDGSRIESSEAVIERITAAIDRIDGIDSAVSPFDEYAGKAISDDHSMAIIRVQFDGPVTDVTEATVEALVDTADIGEDSGLRVEYGGLVFQDTTFGITVTEVVGVVFAALVLVITFGSLLAAGMPLLSALIGVGIVMGLITTLSAFTTVSSSAPLLALMIGLAVGIDYALFIVSRHRAQLAHGEEPEESAAMAVGTAGSAVVFAGVTVIIALLGLLVVGIPFLSVMGIGAAVAVFIAMGVATTLLPALLGFAGPRMIPKSGSRAQRRFTASADESKSMGARWVRGVTKYPWLAAIAVVAILGTLAIPAASLQLSLPDGGSEPTGSTQREAFDLVTEGFGPGYNGPLVVALDITQTIDIQDDLESIAADLEKLDDVDFVSQGFPDEGLDTAIIQVTPSSAPDSAETKALVQTIRDLAPELERQYDIQSFVTGTTAIGIDISNRLSNALVPFGLIVVGLSVVLLMMVFRSVLVPLKAAAGFLLSVVASFGVVVAVFQWGWFADVIGVENPGPILSFMPILLMAVLFGLAMDYEVFLVSGMREEYVKTRDAMGSVRHGFASSARVVTAAALIMFFVFFAFVPEGSGTIKPIALGLAVGIAFDAFLVRMTLVPALMALFGNAAWWLPAWLNKLLPDVDIEGEQLREHRHELEWASTQTELAMSAEYLVAGDDRQRLGPISLAVPRGSLVIASGDRHDRRIMGATLSGILPPLSGMVQVAGYPLPSHADQVNKRVALAEVAGTPYSEDAASLGATLRERLEMTQRWQDTPRTAAKVRDWIARVNDVLGDVTARRTVRVTADTNVNALPQLERSVALAAVGLSEGTEIVFFDRFDQFAEAEDEAAFLTAVTRLADASTTLLFGTGRPVTLASSIDRGERNVIVVDLYLLAPEGLLR